MRLPFSLKFDPCSGSGLNMVFRPHQVVALEILWGADKPMGTREIHRNILKKMKPETISRATIINFLQDLAAIRLEAPDSETMIPILTQTEKTGKGGYHSLYTIPFTRPQLIEALKIHFEGELPRLEEVSRRP